MSALAKLRAARQSKLCGIPSDNSIVSSHRIPSTIDHRPSTHTHSDNDDNNDDDDGNHIATTQQPTKLSKSKRNKLQKLRQKNQLKPVIPSNYESDNQQNKNHISNTQNICELNNDNIDSIVSEFGITLDSTSTSIINPPYNNTTDNNHILSVNYNCLDDTVEAKLKYGYTPQQSNNKKHQHTIHWLTKYKKLHLIKPMEHKYDRDDNNNNNHQQRGTQWPVYHNMGLYTERIQYSDEIRAQYPHLLISTTDRLFTYKYSTEYDHIVQQYLSCEQTSDPQQISLFIQHYPYQPNGCLALSQLCETQADYQNASLLVQRALFTLEQSLSNDINIYNGKYRLDYTVDENKPLYHALYKHIQIIGKRGTSRTALELCKLLLSLSPLLDPTCILCSIDYYAIRAQQYIWLIQFITQLDQFIHLNHLSPSPYIQYDSSDIIQGNRAQSYNIRCPLSYMPNYIYSRALAKYHLEQNNKQSTDIYTDYIDTPTLFNTEYNSMSSSELVQLAICICPEIINELLQQTNNESKLDIEPFTILNKEFNKLYNTSYTPYCDKLVRVYCARSCGIWKSANIIQWLTNNCQSVLNKLLAKQINTNGFIRIRRISYSMKTPDTLASLEKSAYTDDIPRLPVDMLAVARQQQDVARRQDQPHMLQMNQQQLQQLRELQAQLQQNNNNDEVDINNQQNPIAAFLRNLLPWFPNDLNGDALNDINIHDDDTTDDDIDRPGFDDRDFVLDEDIEQ